MMLNSPVIRHALQQTNRRGAVVILMLFLIVAILGILMFVIELGQMHIVKSEIQNAVDAGAMAGTIKLQSAGDDLESAREEAQRFVQLNRVGGGVLVAEDAIDVKIGQWDPDTRTFTETDESPNAVRVFARQDDEPLLFAKLFGRDTFAAPAAAIATQGGGGPQDVTLVIDCSTSMGSNNRMPYTRDAAMVLMDEVGVDDRVSLIVYSWQDDTGHKTGHLETNLDFDHTPTRNIIPQLQPGYYTSGTNIAGGMRAALDEHRWNPRAVDEGEVKVMILLTDGRANTSEPPGSNEWDSIDYYANLAKQENVIIHAVTLGNNASESAMRAAAELTGGTYHHIEDGDYSALEQLFSKLGRGIGKPVLVY